MGAKRSLWYGERKFSGRIARKHLEVEGFLEREKWGFVFRVVKLVE